MNPLRATIEEFAADGYTHVECIAAMSRDAGISVISLVAASPRSRIQVDLGCEFGGILFSRRLISTW